jgi:imidazolonepropionase-like amidohydrolase
MAQVILVSHLYTGFEEADPRALSDRAIWVRDGWIEEVRPIDAESVESDRVDRLDLRGDDVYALPGLIDVHVHLAHGGTDISEKADPDPLVSLRMAHNALRHLKAGVTTVRDMGAKNHIDVHFRRGVELNLIPSPRVLVSGRPIICTGGHCHYMGREADGPWETAKAVREEIKAGVDWIKLMVTGGVMTAGASSDTLQLTEVEVGAAVEAAHAAGRPVAVHAQVGTGIGMSVRLGADSLEHGLRLSESDVELMLDRGVMYVPTLTAFREIAADGPAYGLPDWAVDKAQAAVEDHRKSFELARSAGVPIAAGTDYRHGTLVNELKVMNDYGADAVEALGAATHRAARLLRLEDQLGSVAPGRRADLTVVRGDPVADLDRLTRVEAAVIGGQVGWAKE